MSINNYSHSRLVTILEKSAFRDYGVNRLLQAAKNKRGKIELEKDKIIFTPFKGKSITVDLVKAENTKRWTFSRLFQYLLRGNAFKINYLKKINKFVAKLQQSQSNTIKSLPSIKAEAPDISLPIERSKSEVEGEVCEAPEFIQPEVPLEPEIEPPGNRFREDQIKIMRAILKRDGKLEIPTEGTILQGDEFVLWYGSFSAESIYLQYGNYYYANATGEMIELIFDKNGKVITIYVDDAPHNNLDIPDKYTPLLDAAYLECLKRSSNYQSYHHLSLVVIEAIAHGVAEIPEDHLSKLCPLLKNHSGTYLKMTQLTSDLEGALGNDLGGPAREYLDNLGKGIKQSKILNIVTPKGVTTAFPMAMAADHSLLTEEMDHYENIGILLMFCYHSNNQQNYSIGQCFHPSVLSAALSLRANEIDSNDLDLTTQKKMLRAIIDTIRFSHDNISQLDHMAKALNLYDWMPACHSVPDDDILVAAFNLLGNSANGEEDYNYFIDEEDFVSPNKGLIKQELKKFVLAARKAILTQNLDVLPPLGGCLEPIHYLARGMKSMRCFRNNNLWNTKFNTMDYLEFNKKAQGSLNRDDLISKFSPNLYNFSNPQLPTGRVEIRKKIEWLKEWIKESATDEELEAFLKYTTGSSSLAPNTVIVFEYMSLAINSPLPIAHSCFNRLELSQVPCGNDEYNDHTKEGFIKCLKAIMEAGGQAFTIE